nr:MAG TPA: hypothetical protein [Caudoviricetes sp.]
MQKDERNTKQLCDILIVSKIREVDGLMQIKPVDFLFVCRR